MRLAAAFVLLLAAPPASLGVAHATGDPEVFSDESPATGVATQHAAPVHAGFEQVDLGTLFPKSGYIFKWERQDGADPTTVTGDGIDAYLGAGASDLYREYGVEEVRFLDYLHEGGASARVEVFRAKSPDGAYGLFSIFNAATKEADPDDKSMLPTHRMVKGFNKYGEVEMQDHTIPPLVTENYHIYPGQGGEFFKGRVYGRIAVSGTVDDTHMLAFVNFILDKIPKDGPRPPILRELPRPGMIRGSERYLVGRVSLEELSFPVPGELWALTGSARAATARYRYAPGIDYDIVVAKYPNATAAKAKFDSMVEFFRGDENFTNFPDSTLPDPFDVEQVKSSGQFIGVRALGAKLLLYNAVPNEPMFARILDTGASISVGPAGS